MSVKQLLYNEFNKITGYHFSDSGLGFDVLALEKILKADYPKRWRENKSLKDNLKTIHGDTVVRIVKKLLKIK